MSLKFSCFQSRQQPQLQEAPYDPMQQIYVSTLNEHHEVSPADYCQKNLKLQKEPKPNPVLEKILQEAEENDTYTEVVTVEELQNSLKPDYKMFQQAFRCVMTLGKVLGTLETVNFLSDAIKLLIESQREYPDDKKRALEELQGLFLKKTKYLLVGAVAGGSIGALAHYTLGSALKGKPMISLLTMVTGFAGIGASISAYKFSIEQKRELDNLYAALEVDISSFYEKFRMNERLRILQALEFLLKKAKEVLC